MDNKRPSGINSKRVLGSLNLNTGILFKLNVVYFRGISVLYLEVLKIFWTNLVFPNNHIIATDKYNILYVCVLRTYTPRPRSIGI